MATRLALFCGYLPACKSNKDTDTPAPVRLALCSGSALAV